jgi:glutaminyl-peptide cyclotransferase
MFLFLSPQPAPASVRQARTLLGGLRWRGRRAARLPAAALAMLALNVGCGPAAPRNAAPVAGVPAVDGERALARTAELVALGPRPAGSAGAQRAAGWIAEQCRALGYAPVVDEWTETTATGPLTFRNVWAELDAPGRGAPLVLLGSHYDTKRLASVPDFAGANDSGSSTGLLLELMHVLRDLPPAQRPGSVRFYFFDGEECQVTYGPRDGLHGSRRAAAALSSAELRRCRAMVLLDMVGDRDLKLTLPADTHPALLRRLLAIAERQGVGRHVSILRGTILDDHVPFAERGIPAVDLIDFEYGPGNAWWHTAEDTLDKLAPASLATVGNLALELVLDLLHQPLEQP